MKTRKCKARLRKRSKETVRVCSLAGAELQGRGKERTRTCAFNWMYGVPRRTKRVKSDWSRWLNFWKAMFLTTGGS